MEPSLLRFRTFLRDETKRLGLPAPQFREMSEFMVTFRKAPELLAPPARSPQQEGTLWDQSEVPFPEVVAQNRHVEQRERRLTKAVEYVREHGSITNAIYRHSPGRRRGPHTEI